MPRQGVARPPAEAKNSRPKQEMALGRSLLCRRLKRPGHAWVEVSRVRHRKDLGSPLALPLVARTAAIQVMIKRLPSGGERLNAVVVKSSTSSNTRYVV